MFNEIKAALIQWKADTQYISKIAPNDWGKRAAGYAAKAVSELHSKIDMYEAAKAKEASETLLRLGEKDAEITALRAELTLNTLEKSDKPTRNVLTRLLS